jgi:hypothetical protein
VIEEKFCLTIANYQDPILLEYAQNKSHILPGNLENLTWCNPNRDPAILFPSFYEHVQEKYWGVGLFGYWEFRKIPLFLVAAPTIGFIFYGAFDFLFDMALDARRLIISYKPPSPRFISNNHKQVSVLLRISKPEKIF